MHQPSEVGIMHQLSEGVKGKWEKMPHCHFFLPACETQTWKLAPLVPAALTSSLRLVLPAGSGEQQRMNGYLCVSVAPEGRETVTTSEETFLLGIVQATENSFILSSSLGWNRKWLAALGCFAVYFMYLEKRAGSWCFPPDERLYFFRAALITIDYISSCGTILPSLLECVPLSFCTEAGALVQHEEKNTGFGIRSGSSTWESAVTQELYTLLALQFALR